MLSTLEIKLQPKTNFVVSHHTAPLFHGALMELIAPDYADCLHKQGLKPYSQTVGGRSSLVVSGQTVVGRSSLVVSGTSSTNDPNTNDQRLTTCWRVNALDRTAHEQIACVLMEKKLENIRIRNRNVDFSVLDKKITRQISYVELADEYYLRRSPENKLVVNFNTPTTFKVNGEFSIQFELRNFWQSLLNKWNAFATGISLQDENILDHLVAHSKVIGYNLRSTKQVVEAAKINSFSGEVCILLFGPEQLRRLANLLAAYAEFSGVGAKTGLGMGSVSLRAQIHS